MRTRLPLSPLLKGGRGNLVASRWFLLLKQNELIRFKYGKFENYGEMDILA
jgi:hypothetical protein